MPLSAPCEADGVMIAPLCTMKTLSAVHSADVALVVQHDGLKRAKLLRLDFAEDVVEIIERLDASPAARPVAMRRVGTVTIARPLS